MDSREYWFTETGEWGSNDVETIAFHSAHEGIEEAFDMVQDYQLPDWAKYLSLRPHARKDVNGSCATCEFFADEFGVM
jgi:hypothetical protein